MNLRTERVIIAIISVLPATTLEIIRRTGLHEQTVLKYMRQFRDEKEAYICGYMHQCTVGRYAAIFDLGNLPDAEIPDRLVYSKLTRTLYQRAYRQKPSRKEKQNERGKIRRMLEKVKATQNNPFSALFFKPEKK